MSNIDKQALRKAAENTGADEWRAFIDTKSKTYAVHTPGDNRCGDVVKWAGFDGQQKAANKARYIAAANPANVLALLDELEAAEKLAQQQGNIAVELFDEVTKLRRNADDKAPELRVQLDDAEKRIAELQARDINIKQQAQALFEAIANPSDHYVPAYARCLREALNGTSTGKGE